MIRWTWLFALMLLVVVAFVGCGGGGSHLQIIVDNLDVGVAQIAGVWDTGDPSDGNGCYGPDFLWHEPDQVNVAIVRFTPTINTAGSYRVDIWWSADPNRTTDQPVIVHDSTGDTTYHVNLQQHGDQWLTLGTHTFEAPARGAT